MTRRRCDTGCGRPADYLTPAPWDLALCSKHDELATAAEDAHWLWAMGQTVGPDGQLIPDPRP